MMVPDVGTLTPLFAVVPEQMTAYDLAAESAQPRGTSGVLDKMVTGT